jgi:nitrogen fixation protein NifQ
VETGICISPHIDSIVEQLTGPEGPEARFDVAARRVEYDAIVELMVRERTAGIDAAAASRVAGAVAAGCFGEQHLWRDMGLPDRATLRELLETYFAPFAQGNHRDMRWKKYIYRRLCRWEGFEACRAPSCGECDTYEECFAPEE